jgi:hypothetical protein
MTRFFQAVLCWLWFVPLALARLGVVETRDGHLYEGHVRFESNAVVVVDAAKEVWASVALTNLAGLSLETPPPLPAAGPTLTETAAGGLPVPWKSLDVGSVWQTGGAEFRSGMFRVRSSGTNIFADSDSFQFVFKQVRSNSQVVARVLRVQWTDPWARAGVMMRESLAADARNVSLSVTAGRGGVFGARERKGAETSLALDRTMAAPYWLKLKREGDLFTALKSPNGKQWWTVEKVTLPMAEEVYVGLTVVGVRSETWNESRFEAVEEGASLRNRWFAPEIELRSGSVQSGYVSSMDDTAIRFEPREGKPPVSIHGIAHLRFQPVPSRLAPVVSSGRKGVLLSSGEFIEGECRGIENGVVTISSVPLGLLRYDVNDEVIAVVLAKRAVPVRPPFELKTTDGARWLALEVACEREWVTIREPLLGVRRIAAHQVSELRRNS